jgi:hypothetical protein
MTLIIFGLVIIFAQSPFCHLSPIISIVLDWPKTKAGCFRIRSAFGFGCSLGLRAANTPLLRLRRYAVAGPTAPRRRRD